MLLLLMMLNLIIEQTKKVVLRSSKELYPSSEYSKTNSVLTTSNVSTVNSPENNHEELKETIFDFIRTIKDPEKPATLEELDVVSENCIKIKPRTPSCISVIQIEFNPTVPHCNLATVIGLCIRVKLERALVEPFKLDIYVKEGTHSTEEEINKQINDKERVAAAMENPNLRTLVEKCIVEEE